MVVFAPLNRLEREGYIFCAGILLGFATWYLLVGFLKLIVLFP